MAEFQPEGCKLLVRVEEVKEMTEGGIYLPDAGREAEEMGSVRGEVMAVGPRIDVDFTGAKFKVGDIVIFAKYGGNIIEDRELDGIWRILNDADVFISVVE